jgi:hypothetical protein
MDDGALVEDVGAYDAAIDLCNDGVEARGRKRHGEKADRNLWRGQVARESMCLADGEEGVIADFAADRSVFESSGANAYS